MYISVAKRQFSQYVAFALKVRYVIGVQRQACVACYQLSSIYYLYLNLLHRAQTDKDWIKVWMHQPQILISMKKYIIGKECKQARVS